MMMTTTTMMMIMILFEYIGIRNVQKNLQTKTVLNHLQLKTVSYKCFSGRKIKWHDDGGGADDDDDVFDSIGNVEEPPKRIYRQNIYDSMMRMMII